jgi:hypothetical protein
MRLRTGGRQNNSESVNRLVFRKRHIKELIETAQSLLVPIQIPYEVDSEEGKLIAGF